MTLLERIVSIGFLAAFLAGCGSEAQQIDPEYMKNAEQIGTLRREIFLRTPSKEFDQMAADDKKKFVDTFDGNDKNARMYWEGIKNPRMGGPSIPGQTPTPGS